MHIHIFLSDDFLSSFLQVMREYLFFYMCSHGCFDGSKFTGYSYFLAILIKQEKQLLLTKLICNNHKCQLALSPQESEDQMKCLVTSNLI